MKYAKPSLTYEQQADLVLSRGLATDRKVLIERLRAVGYYRLSAYWHPFKRPDDTFAPGTALDTVWQRYTFDRQLRLWNRELALKPLIPDAKHDPRWHGERPVGNNRIFTILTILHFLLRQIAPQSGWRDRLFGLFDRYSSIPLSPMGIPADWRNHDLWK